MKALAREDLKILMEGDRFSNFIKGNKYRVMPKGNNLILIDEEKNGCMYSIEDFNDYFVLLSETDDGYMYVDLEGNKLKKIPSNSIIVSVSRDVVKIDVY